MSPHEFVRFESQLHFVCFKSKEKMFVVYIPLLLTHHNRSQCSHLFLVSMPVFVVQRKREREDNRNVSSNLFTKNIIYCDSFTYRQMCRLQFALCNRYFVDNFVDGKKSITHATLWPNDIKMNFVANKIILSSIEIAFIRY